MKDPIKHLKRLWKDPINTIDEANARKKGKSGWSLPRGIEHPLFSYNLISIKQISFRYVKDSYSEDVSTWLHAAKAQNASLSCRVGTEKVIRILVSKSEQPLRATFGKRKINSAANLTFGTSRIHSRLCENAHKSIISVIIRNVDDKLKHCYVIFMQR